MIWTMDRGGPTRWIEESERVVVSRIGVGGPPRSSGPPVRKIFLALALTIYLGVWPQPLAAQWLDPGTARETLCELDNARVHTALSTTTADLASVTVRCQDALETWQYVGEQQAVDLATPCVKSSTVSGGFDLFEPSTLWPLGVALLVGALVGLAGGVALSH